MRRRIAVVAAGTIAAAVTVLGSPPAAAEPDTRFGSCREMRQVDPNGVARSAAAVERAVRAGFRPPLLCPTAYRANSRLDDDRDGVACERRR